MSVFDSLASAYDRGMLILELLVLRRLRRRLYSFADGQLLELGVGTGVNLKSYPASTRVIGIDLSAEMLHRASKRSRRCGMLLLQGDVQALPLASASFGRVVSSLLFCSTLDPLQGLQEVARVLKPGGRLFMIEHVRGNNAVTRWLTDRLDPLWYGMNGSCHLNRETAKTVEQAGLRIRSRSHHLWGIIIVICAEKAPL